MNTRCCHTRISITVVLALAIASRAAAQNAGAPWTAQLRGSWVRAGTPSSGDVTIAGNGRRSEIVVAASEKTAVQQAARFLAGDIERISGYRPPIVASASGGDVVAIRMQTLGSGKAPAGINERALRGKWEAYQIVTAGRNVWLVGSNPRGTAFAAYTLAERLGIDPLYHWTGYVPEPHSPLILKRTSFIQSAPTFKYRGFFHDDEDILPRPFDERGYPLQLGDVPLEWYAKFFETALRLRMNMVAPYVRVHRRYEVQKLASDWGLYYTSHHYDILVSNPWGLERFNLAAERNVRPDWNWFTNQDGMLRFWRGGVEENKDLDVIWPVGMRGTADRPYTFPPGTTDEQKAKAFRDAIQAQVAMVHELLPPGKTPLFHFTMYTEMLDQYRRNPSAFDLPDDVIIVWPDDNNGHMRGLPADRGKWRHGVYYHLAYLGGNLSKQLTHIVVPATVAEEFDRIINASATEFMLVNVSELRDEVMGARMIADLTWNAPAIYATPEAANRFVAWWAQEYFGERAAADAYHRYFALLDTPDKLWYAAEVVQSLLDRLYRKVAGEAYAPMNTDSLAFLRSRTTGQDDALAAEARLEAKLAPAQAQFLSENVALGLRVDARQTATALKLDEALHAPDDATMWRLVHQAMMPLEQLEIELMRAEHPPFDIWYHETWIRSLLSRNNPHRSYQQLRVFISSHGRERLADRASIYVPGAPPPPRRNP